MLPKEDISGSCLTGQRPGSGTCFYTGQSPDVQNPKQSRKAKSTNESGRMWGGGGWGPRGLVGWAACPIEPHPKPPSHLQWLWCAENQCVRHVGCWSLPVGCWWWPAHRLRGTLWLLRVWMGLPRLRSTPDWAQAARWSPRESKIRRHRQVRANNGEGSLKIEGEGSGKAGTGRRSRWFKGRSWKLGSGKGGIGRWLTGHSHGMKFCTLGINEQAHFVRRMCCGSYWKLASQVVQRPTHHWIRTVLHSQPVGQRRLGRPKHRWESKLEMYCRYQGLVHWEVAAQNCELWKQHFNTFSYFCCQWACRVCKV